MSMIGGVDFAHRLPLVRVGWTAAGSWPCDSSTAGFDISMTCEVVCQ